MQNEEKAVIQTLYIFMLSALGGSMLVVISSLITSGGVLTTFTISGIVGIITCLSVLWMLRAQQFFVPRFLLPVVVYILATYLIFSGMTVGIRDDAILLYSLVVAMAGLLLGKQGVMFFGVLSILTVSVSIYAEINGWISNMITADTTNYTTMVTVGVTYSLTFSMMYILVNILTTNLEKLRINQQEITQINQELWSIRESLELQVAERTRAAESARVEAEAARRVAESQAWISRGQAQLAEQMRGELDIPTLADNITRHVSQYTGAGCGALFLLSGESLKLTGRYAYVVHENLKSEFLLGEGLVGEVARIKRALRVRNIPTDAPQISSALGNALPRQILVAPLETSGQVFGVLELATLGEFTSRHEEFLTHISESAAIALRSAQLRMQLA